MNPPHRRHCCCCRRRCPHPAMTSTVGRGTAAALRASSSMAAPRSSGRPCGPVALPPAEAQPALAGLRAAHNSEQRTAGSTTSRPVVGVPAALQQQQQQRALVNFVLFLLHVAAGCCRCDSCQRAILKVLCFPAQELKLGNKLADDQYEALPTRAKRVIHDHMHVQDADKVALAEEYEKQMEYSGQCCAVSVMYVNLD
jgi:hypothetical protein